MPNMSIRKKRWRERFKTGGGTPNFSINDTNAKIIGIIRDQVDPLPNNLDCDAQYNGEVSNENCDDTGHQTVVEVDLPIIESLNQTIEFEEREEQVTGPEITHKSTTSSGASPCVSKKKTGSKRRFSQIEELAAHSTSLCEVEKELLIKKYKKEAELLDIKIQNALLKQEILKKKLKQS